jgi:acetylglutamate kinase
MTDLVVVKYGGHAMKEPEAFARHIAAMAGKGERVVVVHGGGPQISRMLDRVGIESRFHQGLRVTTPETMEIVRMVLLSIGKDLVRHLNAAGASAVGLSGEDGHLMTAVPVSHDIGLVGDADEINPALVEKLLADGHTPVVSTIAPDAGGVPHNLNADTAAAALAVALGATELVILTDVPGLFAAWPDPQSLIPRITPSELEELMPKLAPGILPKVEACLRAVRGGVPAARVVGDLEHAGTTVTKVPS